MAGTFRPTNPAFISSLSTSQILNTKQKQTKPNTEKDPKPAIELPSLPRGQGRPPLTPATAEPTEENPFSNIRRATPLYKQKSWSPDAERDEAWQRRKGHRMRRSKSVTDEDLEELKACIELGFGFSPEVDPKLSDTIPALGLYYVVNQQYNDSVSKSSSSLSMTSSAASECGSPTSEGSPNTLFSPGDNPQTVKTRLRQWAQVVGCSVRQSSSS